MFSSLNITLPTATTYTNDTPRLLELQSFGPLLNAKDAFDWLHGHPGFVGWTYTINAKVWTLLQPAKLIVDRAKDLVEPNGKIYNSRIRSATCCHIKCYLDKTWMLIGSLNLVAPTLEDFCVLIKDKKQIAFQLKQFNRCWKVLAP